MSLNEEFINPIDKDKITETPGTLEYAHNVGSALIKPEDKGKLKGQALSAMYQQTDQQLDQIRQQIHLLAEQVQKIEKRKEISEKIYGSKIGFKPVIGHTYHLYQKENGSYQVSMLGENEWGRKRPNWTFLSTVKLLGDHTWEILDESIDL